MRRKFSEQVSNIFDWVETLGALASCAILLVIYLVIAWMFITKPDVMIARLDSKPLWQSVLFIGFGIILAIFGWYLLRWVIRRLRG